MTTLNDLKKLGSDLHANHCEGQALIVYAAIKEIERLTEIAASKSVHVESADCWCNPEIDYVDPDTGVAVYVHRKLN